MKAFCIGRNYVEHAKELKNAPPSEPIVFIKDEDTFFNKRSPIQLPREIQDLHYEAELVLRFTVDISRPITVTSKNINTYIDAITVGLDLTARDLQFKLKSNGLPWEKAKSFRGSAFLGTWLSLDANSLNVEQSYFNFYINEQIVQEGNTQNMIFPCSKLIEHIAIYFNIKAGDVLFTGTPSGVGRLNNNTHLKATLNQKSVFDFHYFNC